MKAVEAAYEATAAAEALVRTYCSAEVGTAESP